MIHFHTADFSKIISFRIKEKLMQKCFRCFRRNRFSGSHHLINTNRRKHIFVINVFRLFQKSQTFIVCNKCINNRSICTFCKIVYNMNLLNALINHLFKFPLIQRSHDVIKYFPALLVYHRRRKMSLH